MSTPAFATSAALPTRHSPHRALTRTSTRMTVGVPRATGGPSAAALYQRAQERREGFFGPLYTSDLGDEHQAIPPSYPAAALRALLGNAHVFSPESSELAAAVERFEASGDAREFARDVAKSDAFRQRFFFGTCNSRFVELCYKLLMGRAPCSQAEVAATQAVLHDYGYDAAVDSLLDSPEYAARFGNVLIPCMADTVPSMGATGSYMGGMPGFCAQMRLQLPTRGANSDVTCGTAQTTSVLAGGNPAGCFEIREAYDVSVPRYEPQMGWMELPRSVLLKDWASFTLVAADAAENWSGLGTPRATGEAKGPWEDGWEPSPSGEEWSPGWAVPVYKKYV